MNISREFSATSAAVLFTEEMRASANTISVQIVSPGTTCTVTYEASNDGVTWVPIPGVPLGWASAPTPASTSTAAGFLIFMVQSRYFRARVSTYTSGTVSGVAMIGEGWSR